jgi:hypothetical protein
VVDLDEETVVNVNEILSDNFMTDRRQTRHIAMPGLSSWEYNNRSTIRKLTLKIRSGSVYSAYDFVSFLGDSSTDFKIFSTFSSGSQFIFPVPIS